MAAADRHNALVTRVIREMGIAANGERSQINVMAESLLVGVGIFNFPNDARKQSLLIQEIADGAQDRAKAIRT